MTPDPKPYLEYLDREMTIMGVLSAFSVAVASFATERIASAERFFLHDLWCAGRAHVVAGAAFALLAALLFYLQRSLLAWYYGQLALAQSRGAEGASRGKELLDRVDGWDTWVRYQTAFGLLSISAACYSFAVAEALSPTLSSIPALWSLWFPLLGGILVVLFRWRVLVAYPQEDEPFAAAFRALRRN